jgi:hypothetical protein
MSDWVLGQITAGGKGSIRAYWRPLRGVPV